MLALKIIGSIFGVVFAIVTAMFISFFVQAANENQNCKLIGTRGLDNGKIEQQYQCADGIHYQPHR